MTAAGTARRLSRLEPSRFADWVEEDHSGGERQNRPVRRGFAVTLDR